MGANLCPKRNKPKQDQPVQQLIKQQRLLVDETQQEQLFEEEEEYMPYSGFLEFTSFQPFPAHNHNYTNILNPYKTVIVDFHDSIGVDTGTIITSAMMTRIQKQIKLMTKILPVYESNSIFVAIDEKNMTHMQALIMGSQGTPYQHGAFLYNIAIQTNYPNDPPTVDLLTTGKGKIRFNPNLYETGYVCLSLLGTWGGEGGQNWQADKSNISQVLVSIQTLVMNEDVFFNQPSYQDFDRIQYQEHNRAYQNIVKYGNLVHGMIEALDNPPVRFSKVIKTHFYLKRNKILESLSKWIKQADQPCTFQDLTQSHNYQLSKKFTVDIFYYKNQLITHSKTLYQRLNEIRIQDTFIEECHKQLKEQEQA